MTVIRHRAPQVDDRRQLDGYVRRVYDEHSAAGDRMARHHYAALIRGGANALHRFGSIIVPRTRDDRVHIIEMP